MCEHCCIVSEKGYRHSGGCRECSSCVHPIWFPILRDLVYRFSHCVSTLVIVDSVLTTQTKPVTAGRKPALGVWSRLVWPVCAPVRSRTKPWTGLFINLLVLGGVNWMAERWLVLNLVGCLSDWWMLFPHRKANLIIRGIRSFFCSSTWFCCYIAMSQQDFFLLLFFILFLAENLSFVM